MNLPPSCPRWQVRQQAFGAFGTVGRGRTVPRVSTGAETRSAVFRCGQKRRQLRNEYKAVTQFLKRRTSTVRGWKKVRKETYSRIGGDFTSAAQEKRFWKAYRKLESDEYGAVKSYGSTETQRLLRQEVVQGGRLSIDDLTETMIDRLDEEYEKQQSSLYGEEFDDYDTGDFFTIGDEDI